jgi:hypothetical protein
MRVVTFSGRTCPGNACAGIRSRVHPGAHARRHAGGVVANDAAAQNHDRGRRNAGDTAQEDAATAQRLGKMRRGDVDGHPAGHLAHRFQKRQAAVRRLDGFIGDADDALGEEGLGKALVRRQVEIREQDLTRPEERVLGRKRFLHLEMSSAP